MPTCLFTPLAVVRFYGLSGVVIGSAKSKPKFLTLFARPIKIPKMPNISADNGIVSIYNRLIEESAVGVPGQ
jgi:hypothetical protein